MLNKHMLISPVTVHSKDATQKVTLKIITKNGRDYATTYVATMNKRELQRAAHLLAVVGKSTSDTHKIMRASDTSECIEVYKSVTKNSILKFKNGYNLGRIEINTDAIATFEETLRDVLEQLD
ncbi:hypothetical protein QP222_05575 [Corynebacterium pyruviciproducens]|uniref:hypothetical protein n=1 Tax=Corynebacterium pyruviciproducens TaxID=598660 RepID=UPI00254DB2EE|nr:hypothetical protein [Corynebacterium pyruviciproducens]MDK6565878.1 hypothetical protein [Corynebacterium pyruviciproducens]